MLNDEETTIRLKIKTRNKVADIGKKDDTFEDIIDRLCDFWIKYKGVVET